MGHHRDLSNEELAKEATYGKGDPPLPYSIGAAFVGLLVVAMLTVGSKTVPFTEFAAITALVLWGLIGLWLILIHPIVLWVPMKRQHKWKLFFLSIFLGIVYFAISWVLMASFSISIR
jgi:hypothetical protein